MKHGHWIFVCSDPPDVIQGMNWMEEDEETAEE